jgi:hypothetical protein
VVVFTIACTGYVCRVERAGGECRGTAWGVRESTRTFSVRDWMVFGGEKGDRGEEEMAMGTELVVSSGEGPCGGGDARSDLAPPKVAQNSIAHCEFNPVHLTST